MSEVEELKRIILALETIISRLGGCSCDSCIELELEDIDED